MLRKAQRARGVEHIACKRARSEELTETENLNCTCYRKLKELQRLDRLAVALKNNEEKVKFYTFLKIAVVDVKKAAK